MTFDESKVARDRAGQFSEKLGTASEVSLSGPSDALLVPFTASWTERDVIPPRARKPRDVQRDVDVVVDIPMASEDEAPVAISFEGDRYLASEYRAFGGRLYSATGRSAENARELFESYREKPHADSGSEDGARAEFQEKADQFLVVGDEVWEETDEPVYTVNTFGMGGNHGGTSLSLSSLTRYKTVDGSPVNELVFPVDQRDAAIEKALEVAAERGDNRSFDHIKAAPVVELSGDFQPGSTFVQPARIKYRTAYDVGWNASREELEEGFAEFKSQILTVPGAVHDAPDGWGGMTKRVDFAKLTERQKDDYHEYVKRIEGIAR